MTMPTREEIIEVANTKAIERHWTALMESRDMLRRIADALKDSVVVPISSMPVEKHPEDGCGDEDFYNRGWNACRSKMLVAAANKENGND
jgi:hypothetical protein